MSSAKRTAGQEWGPRTLSPHYCLASWLWKKEQGPRSPRAGFQSLPGCVPWARKHPTSKPQLKRGAQTQIRGLLTAVLGRPPPCTSPGTSVIEEALFFVFNSSDLIGRILMPTFFWTVDQNDLACFTLICSWVSTPGSWYFPTPHWH